MSWTIKKAECWRIDAFELWCWRRLLRVPWTTRRSNQSILKEISPEYSLEGLMLKLKLQYFGPLMQRTDSLEKYVFFREMSIKIFCPFFNWGLFFCWVYKLFVYFGDYRWGYFWAVLKVQSGYFLPFILKCKKEINWGKNWWAKRNQDLMILEILSLVRLQKTLRADSLSGMHALRRKSRGKLDSLLLALLKDHKIWIFIHTEDSFKNL